MNAVPIRIQRASDRIPKGVSEITKARLEVASAIIDGAENETEAATLIHDLTRMGAVHEATAGDSQRLEHFAGAIFSAMDEVAVAEHEVGSTAVVQVAIGDA